MDLDALTRLFLLERRRFARFYPHVADATLGLRRFKREKPRDCAMALVGGEGPARVYFHPDVVEGLDAQQCRALVRHELAHACEPDGDERETDALAEAIGGAPIYYGPDLIQTTRAEGGRRPRPRSLPK